jgi:DNA polymerase III delta subunit
MTDLATVLDEIRTLDLLARHKLVVIDDADTFLASKGTGSSTPRKAIERYAESTIASATLLLKATSWRPGKLDKQVAKIGLVFKLESLSESDTVRWCIGRCTKEHSSSIELDAAQLLVQRIGTSLTRLDCELGKMSAMVAPKNNIPKEVVIEMVGLSKEEQAWEIQSVLLTGNSSISLTKLSELLDVSKQPKELLMWAVVDLTRRLSAAASMFSNGQSNSDVRKSLKLFGNGGNRLMTVAKRRSPSQFANLFTDAVAIDARSRSGTLDGRRGLELLTARVCREIC